MKLMYSPGACSVGIHVLLEEIGKPYEAQLVNLREGAQNKPDFPAVNSNSRGPNWARAFEALDYAVSTIHMQGFSRLFRASNYTPNPADEDKVKERGKEMVEKGFAVLDKALAGKDYVAGQFSIADSALFYVEFWGGKRMNMKLPANCDAHLNRMLARPAVQR